MGADKSIRLSVHESAMLTNGVYLSKQTKQYLHVKRGIDIVLSAIGILFALPVVFIFAVLIVLEDFGPPFYIQERVGKNGKVFRIIKLRSMRMDAEKDGAKWAEANDPRVTKIGALIRKTRIDELPQLLLVLTGEMSIVGPRPERPVFVAQFEREIEGFENRLLVKPGLTGLAQVNGGYDISPYEKLQYDLAYIRQMSFSLDMKIIGKTFKVLLTGEGAR
ncbi:capsular polysaccharide biosynthesis protein [Weizmannia acidilactici]|uniref:Capsular polysaccharide biosynthesis protein n=1 Tax=Weizmannia acidilactici TaxID=2607726 RepID=A0A5J4JI86_9BACI|nr:sugar transferase [Weizmannia acidilactici]GER67495.1 capsular polysaccharide biosynthesis protein [Weizmannia acidilactici]GER68704.1 capsular polysaccharide biosynthesis protein [Weizmannia acidilactici]